MDLEKRLEEKLVYLNEMLEKYSKLNNKTKGKYRWREQAINTWIEALESLKEESERDFDECYEEDVRETERN